MRSAIIKVMSAVAMTFSAAACSTVGRVSDAPESATIIGSQQQASDVIANGGRVILFGDIHFSHEGHEALVDLMPALERNHVTALAAEQPISLNPFFHDLQSDIRDNKIGADEAFERLRDKYLDIGFGVVGGDQTTRDLSDLIVAAAQHNIRFIGVDHRFDNADFSERMEEVVKKVRDGEDAPEKMDDVLFSEDQRNAKGIANILKTDERIAVMFGVGHLCMDAKQTRLAMALKRHGITITAVALDKMRGANPALAAELAEKLGSQEVASAVLDGVKGQCVNRPAIEVDAPMLIAEQAAVVGMRRRPTTGSPKP